MDNIFLIVAFWLSMLGAIIAICCYLPGVMKVVKFNDTRSMSIWMFLFTTLGCCLWIIIAIFLMIGYSQVGGDNFYFNLASGMGTLISNIGLCTCSSIIFFKKLINIIHAKRERMTEDEYYKKIVEPIIREKIAKQEKLKAETKENYRREKAQRKKLRDKQRLLEREACKKQKEREYIEQYRNEVDLTAKIKSEDPNSDLS